MRKIIPFLIAIFLMTGCESNNEQQFVNTENSDTAAETSAVAVVEEKEETKEYSENDLVVWSFFIDYDAQSGKQESLFAEIKNDRMYFNSGDFTSDEYDYTYGKPGVSEKSYKNQNSEVKRMFRDCYNNTIEPGIEIDSLYLDMAQKVADEKLSASKLSPVDIYDSFPSKIILTVEGNDNEIDVIHSEFVGVYNSLTYSENNVVPCFIDDQGNNIYLDRVQVKLTVPNEQLEPLYTYMEKIVKEENAVMADAEAQKEVEENTEQPADQDTGIIGKWYPGRTDFNEYYIQIDENGSGSIHRDDQVISLTYTFDGKMLRINDEYGGTRDFYYSDGELASDVDGEIYKKKSGDSKDSSKTNEQVTSTLDIIGTWYDPTGLSALELTFNEDGTGIVDWGSSTSNMTYSVSGNTVSVVMKNSSFTLSISGGKLSDGESKYIKK